MRLFHILMMWTSQQMDSELRASWNEESSAAVDSSRVMSWILVIWDISANSRQFVQQYLVGIGVSQN